MSLRRTLFLHVLTLLVGCAPEDAPLILDLNEQNDKFAGGSSPGSFIDRDHARAIAEGFLEAQVEFGFRSEWRGATIQDLTTYYDEYGVEQAHEARVLSRSQEPAGWIMVEAWTNLDPVSAFSTEGPTNLQSMLQAHEEKHPREPIKDFVPLWVGPRSAAIEFVGVDGRPHRFSISPEAYHFAYDGETRFATVGIDEDTATQRASLREMYALGDIDPGMFAAPRISVSQGLRTAVGNGADSFSNFKQEQGTWNSSNSTTYCLTGCTPVAFGILIEYWDRNGYPSLISTTSDNSNTSHTDPDVRWMLNELRWNLQTSCDGYGGQASTSVNNVTQAIDHINSRGAGTWTTDNTKGSTKWLRLTNQIMQGSPVVVHYDVYHTGGSINHSAAAYEYTDNAGTANDWICAEKGWDTSGSTWDCFTPGMAGNYYVTRVMHP